MKRNEERERLMVEMNAAGIPSFQIADRLGISRQRVSEIFKRLGADVVKSRPLGAPRKPYLDEAAVLYQEGASIAQLAREAGISGAAMRSALLRRGISLRSTSPAEIPEGFVEAYEAGGRFAELAARFGLSIGTVHILVRRAGLPLRGKGAPGLKRRRRMILAFEWYAFDAAGGIADFLGTYASLSDVPPMHDGAGKHGDLQNALDLSTGESWERTADDDTWSLMSNRIEPGPISPRPLLY